MPVNKNLHNLRSVLIGPTSRFMFCEDAESLADVYAKGAEDFGNLKAHQLQAESTTEPVMTSLDGITQTVDEQSRLVTLGYLLTSREQSVREMLFAYFGTKGTPFTQAALDAEDGNALAFATTPAKLNAWYELRVGGVPVRNVTAVTITGKVEGVDFVLAKDVGLIRFLTAQTANLTPVITAPEITAASDGYMETITPITKPTRRGYGRLICYDRDPKNKIVFDHRWFRCTVGISNQPDRNSEAGAGELQLKVMIMDDPGTVLARS